MNYIKELNKKYKDVYKDIFDKIKSYKKIAIFRHIVPDFDALGTQYGLYTFLKDNFADKDIIILGDNHTVFTPKLFPTIPKVNDEWFNEPFLGIVVDVGDKKRIADPRFEKADFLIKFDHHPETDKELFKLAVTDTTMSAASELISNFIFSLPKKYIVSKKAAEYLYIALVGDNGRFMFSSTSPHTFEVAERLLLSGIDIVHIYAKMYEKKLADLDTLKFVINNFKVSPLGVAYYVLTNDDLIKLNITNDRGKENVNFFSNYEGIKIWCSITEDVTANCFRISIRSRDYVINGVASEFEGGGHAQAAGAQIKDLSELPRFIEALENVIKEQGESK